MVNACFCGLRFARVSLLRVLTQSQVIQMPEKRARKTMNSTWFANSHACVVYIDFVFLFNFHAVMVPVWGFDMLVKFITPVGARGFNVSVLFENLRDLVATAKFSSIFSTQLASFYLKNR